MLNILFVIWIAASIVMLITWLVQIKTKDASYVDVVWSAGIGLATIFTFLYLSDINLRISIIFILPVIWSFRLTYHLIIRLKLLKYEDSRYQTMRNSFGHYANLAFFIFFQLQAVFIVIFATPIIISLLTKNNVISYIDILGIFIFSIALIGETIADNQLLKHKKHNGKNLTCQSGLWFYSRHPNYFFEWIHWFSYACFSFYTSYFYITLIMPFIMLLFIVYITGIPHVEREALKKKPDYKDYMNSTPMLIPNIFKKS